MPNLPPPPIPARPDVLGLVPGPTTRRRRPVWIVAIAAVIVTSLVAAGIAPLLSGSDERDGTFTFLSRTMSGHPVRWNPCEPVHYVVNVALAPPGSHEDVHEAFRRISAATGIAFVFDDLTDEEPSAYRKPFVPSRYGDRWAPVLVGWVDPDSSDIPFELDDGAVASAVASPLYPTDSTDLYVSGWVAMNREDPNTPGWDQPWQQGPVLLHELGHVMGLGHVDAYGEIMNESGGGATDLGPGDREGLRRLGSSGGCLAVPQAHA
jgi:hypothetical protein